MHKGRPPHLPASGKDEWGGRSFLPGVGSGTLQFREFGGVKAEGGRSVGTDQVGAVVEAGGCCCIDGVSGRERGNICDHSALLRGVLDY